MISWLLNTKDLSSIPWYLWDDKSPIAIIWTIIFDTFSYFQILFLFDAHSLFRFTRNCSNVFVRRNSIELLAYLCLAALVFPPQLGLVDQQCWSQIWLQTLWQVCSKLFKIYSKTFYNVRFCPGFRNYNPSENGFIAFLTLGEGWHNYHHVFPWDYKTSELGDYSMNYSTAFIDFFAKIGWAYDLKTVSQDVIRRRVQRTGDGSHPIWGWGDKDQSKEERKDAIIINKKNKWISKTRNPDQWTCKVMSIRFWVTNFKRPRWQRD